MKIQMTENDNNDDHNEIIINSISDYLTEIKNHKLSNYYSRGEKEKFPQIISSAFRVKQEKSYLMTYEYKSLLRDFLNIVAKDLTPLQNKYFLAFAQHHGLPTNLIDFTTSPLISLFFACYGSQNKDGYIYFINKRKTINLTDYLIDNSDFDLWKLINLFAENKLRSPLSVEKRFFFVHSIVENLKKISQVDSNNETIKTFIKEFKDVNTTRELNDFIPFVIKYFLNETFIYYQDFFDKFDKFKIERTSSYNKLYIIFLLSNIFASWVTEIELEEQETIEIIDLYYKYIYSPPELINRISSQHSLFVSQLYSNEFGNTILQKIYPDFAFKVNADAKKDILKDLDMFGINIKTAYGDYDSIAKYIKEKSEIY